MKPDPEVMGRFLSHLFGNELRGLIELAWRDPQDGKLRHAQLFHLDNLDALIAPYVYHDGIVPGGSYSVQEIDGACLAGNVPAFSSSLIRTMSRWGDVAASTVGGVWAGPDGRVDIVTDVVAVIEKFSNRPGAPSKARADVEPAIPDQRINISDVTRILDGFRNLPYPFTAEGDPCGG